MISAARTRQGAAGRGSWPRSKRMSARRCERLPGRRQVHERDGTAGDRVDAVLAGEGPHPEVEKLERHRARYITDDGLAEDTSQRCPHTVEHWRPSSNAGHPGQASANRQGYDAATKDLGFRAREAVQPPTWAQSPPSTGRRVRGREMEAGRHWSSESETLSKTVSTPPMRAARSRWAVARAGRRQRPFAS